VCFAAFPRTGADVDAIDAPDDVGPLLDDRVNGSRRHNAPLAKNRSAEPRKVVWSGSANETREIARQVWSFDEVRIF
jgi:hypothetical protein